MDKSKAISEVKASKSIYDLFDVMNRYLSEPSVWNNDLHYANLAYQQWKELNFIVSVKPDGAILLAKMADGSDKPISFTKKDIERASLQSAKAVAEFLIENPKGNASQVGINAFAAELSKQTGKSFEGLVVEPVGSEAFRNIRNPKGNSPDISWAELKRRLSPSGLVDELKTLPLDKEVMGRKVEAWNTVKATPDSVAKLVKDFNIPFVSAGPVGGRESIYKNSELLAASLESLSKVTKIPKNKVLLDIHGIELNSPLNKNVSSFQENRRLLRFTGVVQDVGHEWKHVLLHKISDDWVRKISAEAHEKLDVKTTNEFRSFAQNNAEVALKKCIENSNLKPSAKSQFFDPKTGKLSTWGKDYLVSLYERGGEERLKKGLEALSTNPKSLRQDALIELRVHVSQLAESKHENSMKSWSGYLDKIHDNGYMKGSPNYNEYFARESEIAARSFEAFLHKKGVPTSLADPSGVSIQYPPKDNKSFADLHDSMIADGQAAANKAGAARDRAIKVGQIEKRVSLGLGVAGTGLSATGSIISGESAFRNFADGNYVAGGLDTVESVGNGYLAFKGASEMIVKGATRLTPVLAPIQFGVSSVGAAKDLYKGTQLESSDKELSDAYKDSAKIKFVGNVKAIAFGAFAGALAGSEAPVLGNLLGAVVGGYYAYTENEKADSRVNEVKQKRFEKFCEANPSDEKCHAAAAAPVVNEAPAIDFDKYRGRYQLGKEKFENQLKM